MTRTARASRPASLPRRGVLAALPLALGLAACGGSESGTAPDAAAADGASDAGGAEAGTWPRTVSVGGQDVEIAEAPQAIACLSTETTDMVLALVGAERVVAASSGSQMEGSGNMVEEAKKVEHTAKVNAAPEPEQILTWNPDLVITTGRHGNDRSLAESLAQTGVPTLSFSSTDFESPEAVAATLRTLGEALGAEEQAEEMASTIETETAEVVDLVAESDEAPSVAVLISRGGNIMLLAGSSATTNLVELAGGVSAAEEKGWDSSMPADAETLVAANPDIILVQDFRGAGMGPFEEMLDSAAVQDVPAIRDDQVHLVSSRTTSGSAGIAIVEGLREVAEILHPEAF